MAAEVKEIRLSQPDEAARWDELVSRSPEADVYHRAAYVVATAEVEQSQPIGLVVTTENQQFFLPMLLRRIVGADDEHWGDASTPYGYGGVIRLHFERNSAGLFQGLQTWLSSRKLVCCILRSHPLLDQDWLFIQVPNCDLARVTRRAETSAVSLDRWDEGRDSPAEMSKGRRSDLVFARRNLRVTWNDCQKCDDLLEHLRIFRNVYEETMERVNADKFFHFPWSYYERLATLTPNLRVTIAWLGGSPVAGALFIAGPMYAHYHLSASNEAGKKYKASTLLVVEGARWARERSCNKLHLGGGMLPNDSLMMFKRSFGGDEHQFSHVTLIADRGRYDSMVAMRNPPWPYDHDTRNQMTNKGEETRLGVILMGKDKPIVRKGLAYLLENGFNVVAVVGPEHDAATGSRLVDIAARRGIPTTSDTTLYEVLEGRAVPEKLPFSLQNIDLVISLLFWKRIRKPLIDLPRIACINFHPAPLPEFRGIGGYNLAILENLNYWGVAAHQVDETFDTGELIEVRRFDIDASKETAFTLERRTHDKLLALFTDTMEKIKRERRIVGTPQGEGRYFSKHDFEQLRRIQPDDSAETIARKVRAFWYPPRGGASIIINGHEYTLINELVLEWIKKQYP